MLESIAKIITTLNRADQTVSVPGGKKRHRQDACATFGTKINWDQKFITVENPFGLISIGTD